MLKKNKLRLGAVASLAIAGIAFGTVSANADPNLPQFRTLSGAGSDTTQDVLNGLSTVIPAVGSYDATGSTQIQTKVGGVLFNRPNGSTAGVQALSASANNTGTRTFPASGGVSITGQVDFARSSSAPSSGSPGTDLTFIPFAQDALTYAFNSASDVARSIPRGVASDAPTKLTLRNIYACTRTSFINSDGDPVTFRPLIPQGTSGTRSFWLTALGIGTYGSCVTDLGNTVQEHDGSFLTGPGDLVPFSIAQYISQGNYAGLPTPVNERRGQAVLGNIDGAKPIVFGTSGVELNTFFSPSFVRPVFNVVQTSRLGEPTIAATFVGSGSAVCSAVSTIRQYGFAPIGNCGNTTTFKQGFRY